MLGKTEMWRSPCGCMGDRVLSHGESLSNTGLMTSKSDHGRDRHSEVAIMVAELKSRSRASRNLNHTSPYSVHR